MNEVFSITQAMPPVITEAIPRAIDSVAMQTASIGLQPYSSFNSCPPVSVRAPMLSSDLVHTVTLAPPYGTSLKQRSGLLSAALSGEQEMRAVLPVQVTGNAGPLHGSPSITAADDAGVGSEAAACAGIAPVTLSVPVSTRAATTPRSRRILETEVESDSERENCVDRAETRPDRKDLQDPLPRPGLVPLRAASLCHQPG